MNREKRIKEAKDFDLELINAINVVKKIKKINKKDIFENKFHG